MPSQRLIAALLCAGALTGAAPAWAINKCQGPDGKFVFQDRPCPGKGEKLVVRPASGYGDSTPSQEPPAADSGEPRPAAKMSEADRLNAQVAESQRQRRKFELEQRVVPDGYAAIARHRRQCDGELQALQTKKLSANNNLAGATWEQSISSEMTAVATRCDTRARQLRDDLEVLRRECQALGGCAQQ